MLGNGLHFDGEFHWLDRWEFSGGIGGTVKLDLKISEDDEFETEQEEKLTADLIEEFYGIN